MRGVRHFVRDFTATAVKEHLRSQLETVHAAKLTRNEAELIRFMRARSAELESLLTGRGGA
jgi:hypothetical protein